MNNIDLLSFFLKLKFYGFIFVIGLIVILFIFILIFNLIKYFKGKKNNG